MGELVHAAWQGPDSGKKMIAGNCTEGLLVMSVPCSSELSYPNAQKIEFSVFLMTVLTLPIVSLVWGRPILVIILVARPRHLPCLRVLLLRPGSRRVCGTWVLRLAIASPWRLLRSSPVRPRRVCRAWILRLPSLCRLACVIVGSGHVTLAYTVVLGCGGSVSNQQNNYRRKGSPLRTRA